MHSLLFVAIFSLTNVTTGQVMPDAAMAVVPSVTQYAEMFNEYRGQIVATDQDGNEYYVSDAHIAVVEK